MRSDDTRYLAVKVFMMPRDTHPYGTTFGRVLLSYIDQAGAEETRHHLRREPLARRQS